MSGSFTDFLFRAAREHGDRIFLERRNPKGGDPIRFPQLLDDCDVVAAGLLEQGVSRGTHVGLISENCYEWLLCDLACGSIGAVDVPRGTDTQIEELLFILGHSGASFLFVADDRSAEALIARRAELPNLQTVCVMADETEVEGALDLERLRAAGRDRLARDPQCVQQARDQTSHDDVLTVIYTSGTTANPKGVMLTHSNLRENVGMVEDTLHFNHTDSALSILPSWHSYERIFDYVMLYAGGRLIYSDRRRIKDDLAEFTPTIFVAVPRIWEMLYDGIVAKARKQTGLAGKILRSALDVSRRVGSGQASSIDQLKYKLLSRSVLPKIRRLATGGEMTTAVSGGGSLPQHVDETLLGLGLPLLNGYGLTETSPVAAVRTPQDNRPGTIGRPLPRTEIQIRCPERQPLPSGEVGSIWIRGPQVMRGYFSNEEATNRVLTDGWFDSGDLGMIEPDGHVRITGRAKDTIVLAGGENVEPERLETTLKTSHLIDQAIVVGQDQKNLGAILIPSAECLEMSVPEDRWNTQDGFLTSDEVQTLFRKEIDRLISTRNGFRPLERISKFRVLAEPLSIENGMLTQTLKVKRHAFYERFGEDVERMFVS
ncbi:MAG: AMP-binding protein [Planctomycetota bacterium]